MRAVSVVARPDARARSAKMTQASVERDGCGAADALRVALPPEGVRCGAESGEERSGEREHARAREGLPSLGSGAAYGPSPKGTPSAATHSPVP